MGTQLPLPKGAQPPIFGPYLLRPNRCMDQNATWYGGSPRPRRLCVRWGPRSPPQKGAEPPKFLAHVYCGQTAGWIKMALGTEVGLSRGDFVLDGDPVALPQKGAKPPPQFSAHFYCGQTAGCIKMPLSMDVGLSPRGLCVRWRTSPRSPTRGRSPPPNFRPMFIVAKRLDVSRCHLARR